MATALEELQGDELEKYQKFENAVREFYELPHSGNGIRDSSKRDAIIGFAISNFGWNERKTKEEIRRIFRVITLEMAAGTKADRDQVTVELEKADTEVASRKPVIEAKIRELQQELGGLTSERDRLNGKLIESSKAASELTSQNNLPRCVVNKMAELRRAAADLDQDGEAAIVRELETEIYELETIIAGPTFDREVPRDEENAVPRFADWLLNAGYDDFVDVIEHETPQGNVRFEKKLNDRFAQLQRESTEALPTIKQQLAEAHAAHRTREEETNKLREFYIV